jgi:hypothetical protein
MNFDLIQEYLKRLQNTQPILVRITNISNDVILGVRMGVQYELAASRESRPQIGDHALVYPVDNHWVILASWPNSRSSGGRIDLLAPTQYTYMGEQMYYETGEFDRSGMPWLKALEITCLGGGGAGGGAGFVGSGNISLGAGGAPGTECWGWIIEPWNLDNPITVTVGAAGTGVSAGTGGNGGTSSFGDIIVASGGTGGTVIAAGNTTIVGTDNNSAGTVTGTRVVRGTPGTSGIRFNGVTGLSGRGGSTNYGAGGHARGQASLGNGNSGTGLGSGGGGAHSRDPGGVGPYLGGNGTQGFVLLRFYS